MTILRITNGFNRMGDDYLLGRADNIHVSMSDNENFPTPSPTMAALATTIADFRLALSKAEKGSELDVAVKNDRRNDLIDLLHSLGNYVLFTVDGDRTKAVSSGFRIAKDKSPMPPITKPENLQVTEGINAGELKIKFKRVFGARSYMIQFAEENTSGAPVWQSQTCTTSKLTLTQLESGKKYQVRIAVVGTNGQLLYSDPVWKIVQ
jgi:hypothetical protein